ncbi:MAG TPA: PAS domain S-box protein [Spirochaetota bacterium]|nr:PAS domain S-box protein [Spirochaetota bacterium]HPC41143.1 PAS domain S-box protein [Spirochaetota bacterium]HQF07063.1 PAS domain S-box protein [Spirochaetota bacterium]HQJ71680.1 PAS domain S-box protein [Spirochaetota bacterium]HRS78218.1 PAS domain S-box protein [Spirochaetota bacterium]
MPDRKKSGNREKPGRVPNKAAGADGERLLRLVFESGLVGVIFWDIDGRITEANDAFLAMVGYTRDDLTAGRVNGYALTPPEYGPIENAAVAELMAAGVTRAPYEKEYVRKDGARIRVILTGAMLDRARTRGVAFVMDVTGRRRMEEEFQKNNEYLDRMKGELKRMAETHDRARLALLSILEDEKIVRQELRESEEKYRLLIDSAPCIICRLGVDGTTLFVNSYVKHVTGYAADEIIGRNWWDLFYPGDLRAQVAALFECFGNGDVHNHEMVLAVRDGSTRIVRWDSFNARRADGEPVEINGVGIDVTERRKAEDAARFRLRFLYTVIDAINAPVFFTDREGRLTGCNTAFEDMTGLPLSELVGKTAHDLWPRERAGLFGARFREIIAGQTRCIYEGPVRFADGTDRPVMHHLSAFSDETGVTEGVVGVLFDMTELKKAEEGLRLRGEALENAANAVLITDQTGAIGWTNRAFTELTGYGPEEAAGKNPRDLLKSGRQDEAFYRAMWDTILAGRVWHGELVNRRKGGALYDEEMTIAPFAGADGVIRNFIAIKQDITERKRAEQAVRESERFALGTVNALDSSIAILDGDGEIVSVNSAWRTFAFENMRDPTDVFEGINYLAVCDAARGDWSAGAAEFAAGIRAVMKGDMKTYEQEYPCHSASEQRWFVGKVTRFPGSGPVRVVVAHTEITERKIAEEKMAASLREKEVLLKEVHHRVKNNMQVISSLIGLQANYLEKGANVRAALDAMQNRIKSMAFVHERLYQSEDFARINFREYVTILATSVFQSFNVDQDRVGLRLDVGPLTMGVDMAVPCGLMLNELISNALEHGFPDGRRGFITVSMEDAGGGFCRISVKDDGVGLPAAFDAGSSGSLGLRLVNILARQIDGRFEVVSGAGAEFIVTFPMEGGCAPDEGK